MSKSIQERYLITRLTAFFKAFPDERACKEYLVKTLYLKGFLCPNCGGSSFGWIKGRTGIQCTSCSHQVSLTAHTVTHGSHIAFHKWFLAIFLITHDRRGYSALQLAHELKISRRSAGYLLVRLCSVMALKAAARVLDERIESDDAYIGSKGTVRGRGTEKTPSSCAMRKTARNHLRKGRWLRCIIDPAVSEP